MGRLLSFFLSPTLVLQGLLVIRMRRVSPYGEGAPHGDPFFDEASRYPQAYPQLPVRGREVPRIGRGPPPTPSRHGRAVSFDSPDRRHASGNPLLFDANVTPTICGGVGP
ncbi:hypothetical protein B0H14DRAFT_1223566 [Mycena olivaceomarginata]|nr:hypothetical protein B0H14DRAFT_1223566 [Mycena olivaceomarginata]